MSYKCIILDLPINIYHGILNVLARIFIESNFGELNDEDNIKPVSLRTQIEMFHS